MTHLERKSYPYKSKPWSVTLWVSDGERQAIEAIAERSEMTEAEVIESALDDWCDGMMAAMQVLRLKKGDGVGRFKLVEDYPE